VSKWIRGSYRSSGRRPTGLFISRSKKDTIQYIYLVGIDGIDGIDGRGWIGRGGSQTGIARGVGRRRSREHDGWMSPAMSVETRD
jgi:hypothetical protein